MARTENTTPLNQKLDSIQQTIKRAGRRPADSASQSEKKAYSERFSNALAPALASELRKRDLITALPSEQTTGGRKGSETRIAGGLGDKKVDVTYATAHAGLVVGISVKTITTKDKKTGNYQKNLQNRKADLIFELTTLHKRFPYAVVGGLIFLPAAAEKDNSQSKSRLSTFTRAHQLLKIFNRRQGTRNEDEKFEYLVIGTFEEEPPTYKLFEAGAPGKLIDLEAFLSALLESVAERNPEDFIYQQGRVYKPRELRVLGEGSEESE